MHKDLLDKKYIIGAKHMRKIKLYDNADVLDVDKLRQDIDDLIVADAEHVQSTETYLCERIAGLEANLASKSDECNEQAAIIVGLRSEVAALEVERDNLQVRVATLESNAELQLPAPNAREWYAVAHESEFHETPDKAIEAAFEHDDGIDGYIVVSCAVAGSVEVNPVFVPC